MMAQWVKMLDTKSANPNSIPDINALGKGRPQKVILSLTSKLMPLSLQNKYTFVKIKKKLIKKKRKEFLSRKPFLPSS